MQRKIYIKPTMEIMPLGMMVALCGSGGEGDTNENVGGGNNGGNPWTDGYAPHRRTPMF